ncbi:phosphopantetheine-containing protein [Xenophilus sp. AP218F]|nr:phosphopantetheine-containing protein [Xenophilus sp. AP218F]
MDESRFERQVIEAIARVMEMDDTAGLDGATRLEADIGFDSGLFIELLMYLEEGQPGLALDPVLLNAEDFVTVASVGRFLARQLAAQGLLEEA